MSSGSSSSSASCACARRAASGVRIWCAASAMNARRVSLLLDKRSMKRFNAATIWSISRGKRASNGFRSEGSRRDR
ncbi:hypothetical protein G6F23_015592 [Rhizopus arrhizus]|nr:hypothetical protein G6F23_015592 [Rhizopus arrhizus]